MHTQAAQQIMALLDAGQATTARAVFLEQLTAHRRETHKALGKVYQPNFSLDEYVWQRFNEVYRRGCFNVRVSD